MTNSLSGEEPMTAEQIAAIRAFVDEGQFTHALAEAYVDDVEALLAEVAWLKARLAAQNGENDGQR